MTELAAPLPESPASAEARRVALVLVGLGPEAAQQVMRHLDEADVRRIAVAARELRSSPEGAIRSALEAFVGAVGRMGHEAIGGEEFLREVAARTHGADLVRRAFDGVTPPPPPDEVLGPVSRADPEALAMVLSREQPQTVALVLSALGPERAADVLERLPDSVRVTVLRRMATVESVAPEVLREVGDALAAELRGIVAGGMRRVEGKSVAVELLRRIPSAQQGEVVGAIEREDPTLAGELRMKLFTFEDLAGLSDRDAQTLIKDVDMNEIGTALKGASPAVRDRFFKSMSSRAAQMLNDDIAAMGPVRLSEVEKAQASIVQVALGLADKGRITIVRPADKMV